MKKIFMFGIFSLLLTVALQAQEWQTNFETAKKLAAEQNRPIILVFQGSDWCAPCIKLDRQVWSSEVFLDYAKDNFVLVKADFPRKKKNRLSKEEQKHNKALAAKYNNEGVFPLVVVFDQEGQVLGKTGYEKMEAEAYINLLNSFGQ